MRVRDGKIVEALGYGKRPSAGTAWHHMTLEEHDEWLTWEPAQQFAQKRGLPLDEV